MTKPQSIIIPLPKEVWYRYEDYLVSNGGINVHGEWEQSGPAIVKVRLVEFGVAKHTPKGVRLDFGKFVLKDSHKRFACPTIDEAKASYIARKTKQISILKAQLRNAETALKIIQGGSNETNF